MRKSWWKKNMTFTPASLQMSHDGTSLTRNQLRRSRNDLTPRPILPFEVEHSQRSRTRSLRVVSFWDNEKLLKAGGIWDWLPCDPCSVWIWIQNQQKSKKPKRVHVQVIIHACPCQTSQGPSRFNLQRCHSILRPSCFKQWKKIKTIIKQVQQRPTQASYSLIYQQKELQGNTKISKAHFSAKSSLNLQ